MVLMTHGRVRVTNAGLAMGLTFFSRLSSADGIRGAHTSCGASGRQVSQDRRNKVWVQMAVLRGVHTRCQGLSAQGMSLQKGRKLTSKQ